MLVEDWRIEYNSLRPHSALGYLAQPRTDPSSTHPGSAQASPGAYVPFQDPTQLVCV
jgi:transposase InsO family protein